VQVHITQGGPHARTTIVGHHGNVGGQAMVSWGSTPQFVLMGLGGGVVKMWFWDGQSFVSKGT